MRRIIKTFILNLERLTSVTCQANPKDNQQSKSPRYNTEKILLVNCYAVHTHWEIDSSNKVVLSLLRNIHIYLKIPLSPIIRRDTNLSTLKSEREKQNRKKKQTIMLGKITITITVGYPYTWQTESSSIGSSTNERKLSQFFLDSDKPLVWWQHLTVILVHNWKPHQKRTLCFSQGIALLLTPGYCLPLWVKCKIF